MEPSFSSSPYPAASISSPPSNPSTFCPTCQYYLRDPWPRLQEQKKGRIALGCGATRRVP
jgi:hypothetical protein